MRHRGLPQHAHRCPPHTPGCPEEENCRLVTVTNTGGSLDEEELLHIFDSFYRGSNSSKESGSGLGLYICRELMHKMDGEVFASMGEEFSVTVVIRKLG